QGKGKCDKRYSGKRTAMLDGLLTCMEAAFSASTLHEPVYALRSHGTRFKYRHLHPVPSAERIRSVPGDFPRSAEELPLSRFADHAAVEGYRARSGIVAQIWR